MATFDLKSIRARFPALRREQNGQPVAYFDGPAGSQVPSQVADAVSRYLLSTNANRGAPFATSRESDELLDAAHQAVADFLGTDDPDCIAFGPNMTTLTFALSRALGRTWKPGEEILVTQLDHDANVSPWVLAAKDAGAMVKPIRVRPDDCTLDLDDFRTKLSDKTRLLAVGYASNATGTVNPVKEMIEAAHSVGALVFVDAVHYAPHRLIDVTDLDCDFLAVSAYKFFGPHVGVLYGKREHLESLTPYKLRPAPNTLPGKWMTGTQNHEGIAGVTAAIRYLSELGTDPGKPRTQRHCLIRAYGLIREHEESLCRRLLFGLAAIPRLRIWGITDSGRMAERVPTVSVTHETQTPWQLATALAARGLYCWPGNHYALPFTEAMGLEPGGTLRIGLLHYNTEAELDRLLNALAGLV
jgi:cysteine desulfurase family protein (TIGR01976 family)